MALECGAAAQIHVCLICLLPKVRGPLIATAFPSVSHGWEIAAFPSISCMGGVCIGLTPPPPPQILSTSRH